VSLASMLIPKLSAFSLRLSATISDASADR
jgi:hypothetical protein